MSSWLVLVGPEAAVAPLQHREGVFTFSVVAVLLCNFITNKLILKYPATFSSISLSGLTLIFRSKSCTDCAFVIVY